jgi:hypothetical protein
VSKGGSWKRVDTRAFLDATTAREAYKVKGHRFSERISKRSAWPTYCKGCGLVFLRNARTALAVSLGCYYDTHPSWGSRS